MKHLYYLIYTDEDLHTPKVGALLNSFIGNGYIELNK